jgi:SH3-like domain-containing protein
MKFITIWILLCLLLAGCGAPTQSIPAPATTASSKSTPIPPATTSPQATDITPTMDFVLPNPFIPFYVATTAENVMLRAGPGVKFAPKTTLTLGLQLLVLSRAPGGEWIFVQTPFESTGWVSATLLKSDKDLQSAPLMQPPDVQVIRGRVLDEKNEPVTGLSFGILEDVEGARSFTVITDASGVFYGFLPASSGGAWSVTFDKATCASNTMDKDCNCIGACGGASPASVRVVLPQAEMLVFQWR